MSGAPDPAPVAALSAAQKTDLLHRLARVEGQLRGVQKLVAQAAGADDCDAVAQQMAAARKALDRCFIQLLSHTVQTQSAQAGDLEQAREAAARLARLLDKFA